MIETRVFIGGSSAYCLIRTAARSLDVLLRPGRGPAQSLRETAADIRATAARHLERAAMMEFAAELEERKGPMLLR